MNARELRIGNYILINAPIESDLIRVSCYHISKLQKMKNAYFPIPLTEGWLIKFGFEFWGVKSCNEYESYDRWVLHNVVGGTSNYEVHIIHSNYGGVKQTEICYSIDNDERQFIHNTDFIHNLQNAYYLSTGEELTVK